MKPGISRVSVVGIPLAGACALGEAERRLIADATVVAGAGRHLRALAEAGVINPPGPAPSGPATTQSRRTIEINADLDQVCDEIATARAGGELVVVAATGDPGFFGIGRRLAERLGPAALDVRPAASSVAVAFARLGLPWDDAVVASAHGRPLAEAVELVRRVGKAAVLSSPANPPEAICAALAAATGSDTRGAVLSDLGGPNEQVVEGRLEELAARSFPVLSVVVITRDGGAPATSTVGWAADTGRLVSRARARFGRDEAEFHHRSGMITKPEVRAVVLARLELPATGVLWDVGAGSGSIGIEAAGLQPGLSVYSIERDGQAVARIEQNAIRHGVRLTVVTGEAPAVLERLPDPDRAVVGGGGLSVLDAVIARLGEDGRVVATFAALSRAAAAAERLGNLAEVSVNRGRRLPDGSFRLAGADPVLVCWGPEI